MRPGFALKVKSDLSGSVTCGWCLICLIKAVLALMTIQQVRLVSAVAHRSQVGRLKIVGLVVQTQVLEQNTDAILWILMSTALHGSSILVQYIYSVQNSVIIVQCNLYEQEKTTHYTPVKWYNLKSHSQNGESTVTMWKCYRHVWLLVEYFYHYVHFGTILCSLQVVKLK